MSQSCPISIHRIDAHFVRFVAFEVLIIGLLLLITEHLFFSFLLLFDFLIRTLKINKLSPFTNIAKLIIHCLDMKPKFCDEAPKRFSLYLGLGIVAFLTFFLTFGYTEIATILVIALLICAFLEAAFDYCVGCKVYYYLQHFVRINRRK
ncbi:DUF4395 domain-containing protein [Sulfurovum sp. XTW-4]|uniref:DUF4395 domain-containing protein n=1 Tax=Sulfurovum xiamenensis TaxID=3019066 RepID=A0ABT7QSA7_9BACT|nr:DUF4395 domain-containing protein [Sulfurovum xiamenensis]MDM5263967.1 DUF4395 domain-containing protein [Sulfurovum xiamenensis]